MSYQQMLKINPTLARQLARKTVAPGESYWHNGRTYRKAYKAVNK